MWCGGNSYVDYSLCVESCCWVGWFTQTSSQDIEKRADKHSKYSYGVLQKKWNLKSQTRQCEMSSSFWNDPKDDALQVGLDLVNYTHTHQGAKDWWSAKSFTRTCKHAYRADHEHHDDACTDSPSSFDPIGCFRQYLSRHQGFFLVIIFILAALYILEHIMIFAQLSQILCFFFFFFFFFFFCVPREISWVHHFGWDFCVCDRFSIQPLR